MNRPGIREYELSPATILLYLTLVTIAGALLRIVVAQMFLGGLSRGYEGDESGYMDLAVHVAQGLGFTDKSGSPTSYIGPGLPFVLLLPISVFGSDMLTIRLFMCFIESLLVPACYLLGKSMSGSRTIGLIAAATAVVFPTWIIPSGAILTDITATIATTLLVCMLIESHRRESLLWATGAGILWGSSILIRAVSLSYAPAIILWLVIVSRGWRRRLGAIAAVVISAGCILAPWTIRNTRVHGTFVPVSTQGGFELYKSNNPEATGILAKDHAHFSEVLGHRYPNQSEAARNQLFQADAVRFILENPYRFAELCLVRLLQLWKLYSPRVPLTNSLAVIASFGLALPFFFIQALRCGSHRGPEMLVLSVIICHTAVHAIYGSLVRYRLPLEPMIVVMAIQGFSWFVGILRDRPLEKRAGLSVNISR
jgi:4-amino-4-deoxy-L-arabinose transferase-like glycosyltransferase